MLQGMGETISKKPVAVAIPTILGPVVTVTERAASKAQSLLAAKGKPDGMLRVFVVGGGCSGYQYGMAIAEQADAEDQVIEASGVRVVVDRESAPMISGAEIDYVEDLMKSGFTIYNPNATSSCACGSSFQSASNPGTPRACN
jgi:iron-sulfur cluster assembly protein